jgi:hypothetical protein
LRITISPFIFNWVLDIRKAITAHEKRRNADCKTEDSHSINSSLSFDPFYPDPPPPTDLEKYEVYDLETDPFENTNFALTNPVLIRQLVKFTEIHFVQKCEWTSIKTENKDEIREQLRALGYFK